MTVSPLPLVPSLPGASASGGAAGSATGGAGSAAGAGFAALVAQLLSGPAAVAAAGPDEAGTAAPGAPLAGTGTQTDPPTAGAVDQEVVEEAEPLAAVPPVPAAAVPGAVVPGPAVAAVLPTLVPAPTAGPADPGTPATSTTPVESAAPVPPAGRVVSAAPVPPAGNAVAAAGVVGVESGTRPVTAGPPPATTSAVDPGAATTSDTVRPTVEPRVHVADPAPAATGPSSTPAGPDPSSGTVPTTTPGAAAQPASAGAPPAAEAPGAAVSRQVLPELTRLVAAGNGTHRVTLQLNPEALGEVRVVLSVRDGEVHVRLAAGTEAQRALVEGAPELHRLLELAGASDTKIVVRDLLGSAPGTTTTSGPAGQGGDGFARPGSGEADPGADRSHDQHAGTRGGRTARDGTHDGASPPRPVDQVTDARTTGVDVTV